MFESFFGPKNPTKKWQRADDLRLEFDLEQGSLNGVRLGDPLEAVSFLGPIEDRKGLPLAEYGYYSLGLRVCCHNDENIIDTFEIVQDDDFAPQYLSYSGRFHFRGKNLPLAQLNEQQFVREFGLPFWRDEDAKEIILFYEFSWLEWQVELRLDGSFKCLVVTSNPILAGASQRAAYGVTKPWPPRD